jgi:hypothetical protein
MTPVAFPRMGTQDDTAKLVEFIRVAKQAGGTDDQFVTTLLRHNGWSEQRIYDAFTAYYAQALGTPPPVRGSRLEGARDAFFYLLAFLTLGTWTIALIWLAVILIDRALPDAITQANYFAQSFRHEVGIELACLIVAFPIFIFVSRAIVRETRNRPEALESGVRKWLTYIALVLAAATLICDAVSFLQQFLVGDLTIRFALKALVVFAVATGIFWYYLGTVRPQIASPARDRLFGWAATAVVVVAIVLGFTGIGTPAYQRHVALDERRVSDLQDIEGDIALVYISSPPHVLPRALNAAVLTNPSHSKDPSTGEPYAYIPGKNALYTLCASFDIDNRREPNAGFWSHPAGRKCYTLSGTEFHK